MQRRFTQFVESPTRENYLAARDAVLRATPLAIGAADLAELVRLLDADQHEEVQQRIDLLPASKALSPRIHFLAAEAADGLGDAAAGELERYLFVLCLQGLLATGDGSAAAPYSVCHASDEHDLLEAHGLEPAAQSLVASDGKLLDVITCTDGRECWFDVTAVFAQTRHRLKAPRARRKKLQRRRVSRAVR